MLRKTVWRKTLAIVVILWLALATMAFAGEVSLDKARIVAENWLTHYVSTYGGWAGSTSPKIKAEEIMIFKDQAVGYNFLVSPKGHIIVPYRDELPPVKLYSERTTLSMQDNSGFVGEWIREELFKLGKVLVEHAVEMRNVDFKVTTNGRLWALFESDRSTFTKAYETAMDGVDFLSVGPLLTTTWGQDDPYNLEAPLWFTGVRTVTGCVATAAAQIMRFWNYPTTGQGSTSYSWSNGSTTSTLSRDFSTSTYDWANMLTSYSGGQTTAQKNAVAKLMGDVGVAFHMGYDTAANGGSGADTMEGVTVFPTYFKYSSTINAVYRSNYANDSAWMQVFKTEVQAGRPSQLRIRDPNAGGHSVVVDGYRDSPSEQIHLNMGWTGSYDAWYVSNNIVTGSDSWSDVNYQGAVIGIDPVSGAATQISPFGTIYTATPTYTWYAVSNATHYQLHVDGSGTWYTAAAAGCGSGTGTCSITGSAVAPGSHTWYVQTYNSYGVGAWSSGMGFIAQTGGGVPGAATLISPTGTITDTTPTYTWNAVSNASYYQLHVNGSGTWYPASAVGCSSGTGTCSFTGSTLANGSYTWYVQTYNIYGVGAWSSGMGFTVSTGGGVPDAATLISPTGIITTTTPTYVWNAVSNASYYYLYNGTASTWYTASQAGCGSGTGTCSFTGSTLANGSYTWYVQTYNSYGVGAWSSGMNFTIATGGCTTSTITSPANGSTIQASTTFTWANSGAEYWLEVGTSQGGNSIYTANQGTDLSRALSSLPAGTIWARLWTRCDSTWTYNDYSYTVAGGVPPAPTLISPTGTITTTTPTYMWNAVLNATYYQLWVNGYGTWYPASSAGCGSGTGTCSITGSTLANGSYTWYVQTYNSYGIGSWSSGMSFTISTGGGVPANMVLIPAGSFQMGDAIDGDSSAMPVHTVTVSAFYLDKYEVTKALWDEVYAWSTTHGYGFDNAGSGTAATHPVQTVSWYDVVKWLNARSEKEGRQPVYYTDSGQATVYRTGNVNVAAGAVKWTAEGYRLPTEAEWEYAARGGTTTRYYTGSCISSDTQANYNGTYAYYGCGTGQYRGATSVVGSFPANPWGLYDMAGNVWEWTWDWYGSYSSTAATNPRGPASGSYRVGRGGSWYFVAIVLRSAHRAYPSPSYAGSALGFRAALSQP
jgi:formylglycine-generating enzyme required for sulfatase activity